MESTALVSRTENLPHSPAETGYFDLATDFLVPFAWSENRVIQGSDVEQVTADISHLTPDLGHSNFTGGLKVLLADSSPFVERVQLIPIGSGSTTIDQDRPVAEGSTADEVSNHHFEVLLLDHLNNLVDEAVDEVFVDGMESALSKGVKFAVEAFGGSAISAIEKILSPDSANVEIVGEILRQLGAIEDPQTHYRRLRVLETNLESSDPRIRDAASIGIAALDDPAATDAVCRALDREGSFPLQRNLNLVLDQLQATQSGTLL